MQITPKVVDMFMPDEGAHHIASLMHRSKKPAIHPRGANILILHTIAGMKIPYLVIFGNRDMEKGECGQWIVRLQR